MVGYSSYATGDGMGGFGTLGGGVNPQRNRIAQALMDVQNPPPPSPVTPGTSPAMPGQPQPMAAAGLPGGQQPGVLGGGAGGMPPGGMAAPVMPGGMPGGTALAGGANMQQLLGQQPLSPGLPRY